MIGNAIVGELFEKPLHGFHKVVRAGVTSAGIKAVAFGADKRFFGKADELTALMFGKRKRVDVVIE